MDDNDELEFVEEDYYAFLNVPRNVGLIFIDNLGSIPAARRQRGFERVGFVI